MTSQKENHKISIILAVITTLGVLGTALFNNWDQLFQSENSSPRQTDSEEAEFIAVHFDVREINENPIDDVEVRFVFEGAPVSKYTDDNGYTVIELPRRNDVEVTLTKTGFVTQRLNINLLADRSRTKTIYLEKQISESDSSPQVPLVSPEPVTPRAVSKIWSSETGKTKFVDLDKICNGKDRIESIETVFGYDKPPFYGNVTIFSPKSNGCMPGDEFQGNFNLSGRAGNCVGNIAITWQNANRSHIKWDITNLGTSCPVGRSSWEIPITLSP
jgi:hypothetical protein